jgi:asparagine synthase (glutamine-hydrolysing)
MCQTLTHRGPDDDGAYLDDTAMMGFRRLSIIDLALGQQPITNEDGTIWLVFNGEIYNYREVRTQLQAKGHIFATASDSEVIVHAYEAYGERCVDHFNGMFAFAIWDKVRRLLFLARDRIGIKPLYFWAGTNALVFGSELSALMAHPLVPRQINFNALDQFLTVEYVPTPGTILQGVQKLPPGHWLRLTADALCIQPYWDVPFVPHTAVSTTPSSADYTHQLQELIQDAVRLRLVSDVPLGAFLSGGIDSSTIVAAMSGAADQPVRTFSIGFQEASYNELPFARLVAQQFHTRHEEEVLSPDISALAAQLIAHLDEPLADFSIFPTYLVSALAARHVKVALSGDGGDELFGGYETYKAQNAAQWYGRIPTTLRQQFLPSLLHHLPPQPAKKGLINKAKRFVEGVTLPAHLQHTRWMLFLSDADKAQLYQPELQAQLQEQTAVSFLQHHFTQAAARDPLAQQQYVDIKTYLADNILTKVDRMSMAASLEARTPLLDHRIVEFAVNLPPHLKLHRGQSKIILRQAMHGRLPQQILTRPKEGFSIPLKQWLQGPLRPLMTDLLAPDTIRQRGYFQPATISRWITEHLNGRINHSHRLWSLMVLELWLQTHHLN